MGNMGKTVLIKLKCSQLRLQNPPSTDNVPKGLLLALRDMNFNLLSNKLENRKTLVV